MIRGAIFDLDGTLLDSNPYWAKAPVEYLASFGKRAAPDLTKTLFPMTVPEATAYMIREYGLNISPEEFSDGIGAMMENFYRYEIPMKVGIPMLLRKMKERKIPCTIASVTDRPMVEAALRRHGILPFFSGIVTTADVGIGKHAPDVYLRAAEGIGSEVQETLVFEDALHALKTAKGAGFRTVGVYDRAMDGRKEELLRYCDYYLEDFSDLSGFLRALDEERKSGSPA